MKTFQVADLTGDSDNCMFHLNVDTMYTGLFISPEIQVYGLAGHLRIEYFSSWSLRWAGGVPPSFAILLIQWTSKTQQRTKPEFTALSLVFLLEDFNIGVS
ncbi:unnamed protein product [Allacma fusca]|uniref:Uncharacterized protein n=1 Tax=Allacma fusca TaxID=39272 RepID=A0A8J2P0B8_9HEXA|nr:unnamed protein product [Allacma fusca]